MMPKSVRPYYLPLCFILCALSAAAQPAPTPDPEIQKIVSEISQDKIAATMQRLAAFQTRGNFTDPAQTDRGIGAARRWILEQFQRYSPRLEVSFDPYKVKKKGTR